MAQNNDKSREAFEAWFLINYCAEPRLLERKGESYVFDIVANFWEGWQARQAEVDELRGLLDKIIKAQENCDKCFKAGEGLSRADRGYNRAIKAAKSALRDSKGGV